MFEKTEALWQKKDMCCSKQLKVFFWLGFCLIFVCACKEAGVEKDQSQPVEPAASLKSTTTPVVYVHWIGKKRLAGQTNAATLLKLWNLPESLRLESQTRDKLAQSLWWLPFNEATTNSGNLVRPYFDELLSEEFYFQLNQGTNGNQEWALAIRLDAARAALWETNLAAVTASLTGIIPAAGMYSFTQQAAAATNTAAEAQIRIAGGWRSKREDLPDLLEFMRIGEWVVIGAAQEQNTLLLDFSIRLQTGHVPFESFSADAFLEVDVDFGKLIKAYSISTGFPRISLIMRGDGENVVTRADLTFPKALELDLPAWNIPTNLIHEPLASFAAARGIAPWVAALPGWKDLGLVPNEIYVWAAQGVPMQTYFVGPLIEASNKVFRASEILLEKGRSWFARHDLAGFQKGRHFNGLEWTGLPYMSPFLQSTYSNGAEFIFGGAFVPGAGSPISPDQIPPGLSRTNLMAYHSEITGLRVSQWIYMAQFIRTVSDLPQLPPGSVSMDWLKALSEHLGSSISEIAQINPRQISMVRKSGIGLTALELHFLADWLESPNFPRGLNSLSSESLEAERSFK